MAIESTKSISGVSQTLSQPMSSNESAKMTRPTIEVESTQVTLSDAKKSLYQTNANDVDMQRVEQIKQAIREGKFTIDSEKIADALISEALELVGRDKI